MIEALYPLKFKPILKEKIWGGTKLKTVLGKKSDSSNLGESWEISGVEGDVSVVSNGILKNKTLKVLLETYKADLIGEKNYALFGDKFPLLIKFIDAKDALSVQLHPNDELAAKRHNSFGKTEMWYVMQADKDANLIVGFNQQMTLERYVKHLNANTLPDILNYDKVVVGDAYFIAAGRLHAIGAGVLLAEIQQTSDVTYRVYDWDRIDNNGNARELHNDLAIQAFDFQMPDNYSVDYQKEENKPHEMVSCSFFTTNFLKVNGTIVKHNTKDSFIIYMCVEGEVVIETNSDDEQLKKGETLLIPAAIETYKITSTNATLLEVYV